jgi:isopenicillin N synthase-like dioxygenase
MPDLDKILTELTQQGYAPLPFSLTKEYLNQAAESFMDFLELPEKTKFSALAIKEDRGSTIGYMLRHSQKDTRADNKEYVHYNEYFERFFKNLLDTGNPRIDNFVNYSRKIYKEAKRTIQTILDTFEPLVPGISERFISHEKLPRFYLRFIKYDCAGTNGLIAKGHYDRGALTLALSESSPGLRIGKPENLKEIVHEDSQAILFPGRAITEITDRIKPAWHDAVQKNAPPRPGVSRWAIVFFADLINQPDYTWEQAHTMEY